jgi:PHD/YefM family antitoxin component YafN of YafNO toxin-antitoxin module
VFDPWRFYTKQLALASHAFRFGDLTEARIIGNAVDDCRDYGFRNDEKRHRTAIRVQNPSMTPDRTCGPLFSFHALRILRQYQNEFRERMEEHLAQRCQAAPAGYVVSTEDIQAAVAYAYEQYIEEKKAETLLPPMNAERLQRSREDIAAGRTKRIEDVIDVLQG